jgi:hypothetical protein
VLLAVLTLAAACWYAFVRMMVDGVAPMWGDLVIRHLLMGAAGGAFLGFLARCTDDCNPFAEETASLASTEVQPVDQPSIRTRPPRTVHVLPAFGTRAFGSR